MTDPDVGFSTLLWMTVFTIAVTFDGGVYVWECFGGHVLRMASDYSVRDPSLRSRKTYFSYLSCHLGGGRPPDERSGASPKFQIGRHGS